MVCDCALHRRGAFGLSGRFAAGLDLIRAPFTAAWSSTEAQVGTARSRDGTLPRRGEFVIRGGHVLTMDPRLGDLPRGDVHVRDGAIIAVGADLAAPDAEVIDGQNRIVMPGFVDTHWHLWNTALRAILRGDDPQYGYFPTTLRVGPHCTPHDAYVNVRLGVAEGLLCGVTTVHNWSHNTVTPEHADAEIQALKDIGVRARFSYGTGQGAPLNAPMNLADLARVQRQWTSDDGMLHIGACLRTPGASARGQFPLDVLRAEVEGVRRLGLPMTMHTGPQDLIGLLAKADALGRDMLLVHPQGLSAEERQMVADTGTLYSIAPVIEMSFSAVRNGYIQYSELEALRIQLGLSIDSSSATNADFFNVMRALMWSDWRRTGAPLQLKPRRLVELATIEGARALRLDDKIGSLTPGKRADLILVRANDLNMAPIGDPYYAMVFYGVPSNVETVVVDGRILKSGGKLTAIDVERCVDEAVESTRAVSERAARGAPPP